TIRSGSSARRTAAARFFAQRVAIMLGPLLPGFPDRNRLVGGVSSTSGAPCGPPIAPDAPGQPARLSGRTRRLLPVDAKEVAPVWSQGRPPGVGTDGRVDRAGAAVTHGDHDEADVSGVGQVAVG